LYLFIEINYTNSRKLCKRTDFFIYSGLAAGIGRDAKRVFLPAKIPEAKAVALESPFFAQQKAARLKNFFMQI